MNSFYQFRTQNFQNILSHNNNFPAHLHKQVELLYVLSGKIIVTIDNDVKELKAGDCSIAFPNTIHYYKTEEESHILLLIFDAEFVSDYLTEFLNYRPLQPFVVKEQLSPDVLPCIDVLASTAGKPVNARLMKGYLLILLCRLFEQLTLEKHEEQMNSDALQTALIYIDCHFTESISLEDVAKHISTSKFHLSRFFSKKLQTSFNAYVNNRRVELAKTLLRNTNDSITSIAFDSGFNSTRSFYRAFQGICGMTPMEYRIDNRMYN
ncbi:helix-turn-helix transcriptional regulator [Clostridium sp. Marseille-P299]|uniref:helix-turn-helix transcriptional regulator n=1 Tax=Clostridium sp. Marseille-P299 TaxID=1805477 RepID=UPI00082ECA2C|nr:AraC family transcriptional regulator [Clostridium sp. Marseille-P299]